MNNGYHQIKLCQKTLLFHRVVWAVYYQQDPYPHIIDHKDTNPGNNRIGNLRLASHSQNSHNTGYIKPGRDLPLGVQHHYDDSGRFLAQIVAGNRKITKYGFATPEEAHVAYLELKNLHFGEFSPYYCATG